MISTLRQRYNAAFRPETYQALLDSVQSTLGHPSLFRIAETPVFIPNDFRDELLAGCEAIFDQVCRPDIRERTEGALSYIPRVPGDEGRPVFMVLDFGVCEENGRLVPRLIEGQGFPSLFCFQPMLADFFRQHFDIPTNLTSFLGGHNHETYFQALKEVILAGAKPENVVLLEVEPEKQGTNIDFYATEYQLGVKTLCLTDLKRSGRELYYLGENGRKIPVQRIYNRVIFDELEKRNDLSFEFRFSDEVDVEWVEHPHWFFRISKYTLPLLDTPYVPKSHYLHQLKEYPADLENYVLKPLFSFAGMGVKINVRREDLDAVEDRENYILQRKVNYLPIIPTLDVPAKCEVRMMTLWHPADDRPKVVNTICRLSKGEMVGVRYNKDKEWVGGTVGFFEH